MVLRTSRAGSRFWGCSGFPSCRHTIDVPDPDAAQTDPDSSSRTHWVDYGRRPGWIGFYAPAGGRLRAADALGGVAQVSLRRATSQAAFFLTDVPSAPLGPSAQIVLDIARRLLSRGDRPPVDGLVEAWVIDEAGLSGSVRPRRDPGDLAQDLDPRARLPTAEDASAAAMWREAFMQDDAASDVDNQPLINALGEADLFAALVDGRLGVDAGHWILPQASLAALSNGVAGSDARRVDFLVSHPSSRPVVIEVDGVQHARGEAVDADRDRSLEAAGIDVRRVSAADVRGLAARLAGTFPGRRAASPSAVALVWGPVVAARVARALVEAVASGWVQGATWTLSVHEPLGVGPVAIRSTLDLLAALCEVWSADLAPEVVDVQADGAWERYRRSGLAYEAEPAPTALAPVDARLVIEPFHGPWHRLPTQDGIPTVAVRSAYLPVEIRDPRSFGAFARRVPDADRIDRGALERLLRWIFAKREFYPADRAHPRGQEIAIRRILGGSDTAVLLPTGAGKSLIYQLAGLLLPGVTVVVDPIVALIEDQLEGLAAQGIDRAIGITGVDTRAGRAEAKLAALRSGDAIFCFVAPQRLQSRPFRDALRELAVATPISIAVVDEAHCVSEWGHTFMAAYLGLARALRETGRDAGGTPPPVLALTGTASRSVLRDMLVELEIDRGDPGAIVVPDDFDRPELSYAITSSREDEVLPRLMGTLRALPAHFRKDAGSFYQPSGRDTNSGIIFVQTVNPSPTYPDLGILNVSRHVATGLGVPVGIYAGSAPRGFKGNWDDHRRDHARAFKRNDVPVLVATKAFGMGIDKSNIRFTVHLGIPGSIEAFYQEAGRAGRDRQPSRCVIVHDPADGGFWEWAHQGSFRGVESDLAAVRDALSAIGELGPRRRVDIPMARGDAQGDSAERAVHRLRLLGVVEDYTVDWGGSRFELLLVKLTPEALDSALLGYVRRTQPGRVAAFEKALDEEPAVSLDAQVLRNARQLITFIYDTVASARVQALAGMQELAERASSDKEIRERILAYLELGQVAGDLERLTDQEPFRFEDWQDLYVRLDTIEDGREWRGATTRLLESSPDHPGLLVGRALAESIVPQGDTRLFSSGLAAAFRSAIERYDVAEDDLASFAEWVIAWLHERKPAWSGLALLIAEHDPSLGGDTWRGTPELAIVRDTRIADPHELAMAIARTQDRVIQTLTSAAAEAEEMLRA